MKKSLLSCIAILQVCLLTGLLCLESKGVYAAERHEVPLTSKSEENCQSSGYPEKGSTVCKKEYGHGGVTQAVSDYEMLGDEFKQQTLLTDFDRKGIKTHSKSIRQKTNYTDDNKSGKVKEFIDIVDHPADGKITREILVFQYHPDGKKIQVALWAKYHRIGNSGSAGLSNYISLYYDENGNPSRGRAEVWQDGKPVSTPFFWSSSRAAISKDEVNRWKKYESRVYDIARGSLNLLALHESSF